MFMDYIFISECNYAFSFSVMSNCLFDFYRKNVFVKKHRDMQYNFISYDLSEF